MSRRAVVTGLVIASVAIVAALSDGALAAKKQIKPAVADPPPLPPAAHNWSGFYAGVNAGIAWGAFNPTTSTASDGTIGPATTPVFDAAGHQAGSPFGFGGGAQA